MNSLTLEQSSLRSAGVELVQEIRKPRAKSERIGIANFSLYVMAGKKSWERALLAREGNFLSQNYSSFLEVRKDIVGCLKLRVEHRLYFTISLFSRTPFSFLCAPGSAASSIV